MPNEPDYKHYLRFATWTRREAICLLNGWCPNNWGENDPETADLQLEENRIAELLDNHLKPGGDLHVICHGGGIGTSATLPEGLKVELVLIWAVRRLKDIIPGPLREEGLKRQEAWYRENCVDPDPAEVPTRLLSETDDEFDLTGLPDRIQNAQCPKTAARIYKDAELLLSLSTSLPNVTTLAKYLQEVQAYQRETKKGMKAVPEHTIGEFCRLHYPEGDRRKG